MDLGLILKLFHVLAAIWLVSGMIGRAVTYSRAARENDVHFPLYLIPRRIERMKAIDQAIAADRVTSELSAAINNRGVTVFRAYEFFIVIAILTLMVLKPF